jgi:GTP cyclohydrolase II
MWIEAIVMSSLENAAPAPGAIPFSDGLCRFTTTEQNAVELVASRRRLWLHGAVPTQERREALRALRLPIHSSLHAAPLPTNIGGLKADWTYLTLLDHANGAHHSLLVYGDWKNGSLGDGKNVLVRVHSTSRLGDTFFGRNGNSELERLTAGMREIAQAGRGVVVCLEEDGRGHGAAAKMKSLAIRYSFNQDGRIIPNHEPGRPGPISIDRSYQLLGLQSDTRDFRVAVSALRELGVQSARLITECPDRCDKFRALGMPAVLASSGKLVSEVACATRFESTVQFESEMDRRFALNDHLRFIGDRVQEAFRPWEVVARNKALLASIGSPTILRLGSAPAPTRYGDWTIVAYGDYTTGEVHYALVYGDLERQVGLEFDELPVRVHSSCRTNECFHSTNCECQAELRYIMRETQKQGHGVILWLDQEGRGTGIFGKMQQLDAMFGFTPDGRIVQRRHPVTGEPVETEEAYRLRGFPPECRDFTVGPEILADLRLKAKTWRVFTNNPGKVESLPPDAFPSVVRAPIIVDPRECADPRKVLAELHNKRTKLRHVISDDQLAQFEAYVAAMPPEPIRNDPVLIARAAGMPIGQLPMLPQGAGNSAPL